LIDELIAFLYESIRKESEKVRSHASTTQQGFALEDSLSLDIAQFCHEKNAASLTCYPPRYELDAPTFSGQVHQFDLMVKDADCYVVAECKRRKGIATRDQILTFGAKLIDYGFGFHVHEYDSSIRGLFLSTTDIPDGSVVYALGTGIEPVTPSLPPIEYLLTTAKRDMSLMQKLLELKNELVVTWPSIIKTQRPHVRGILESYKNHYALWKEAIDSHD
jgi:hypothetical protein